MINPYDVIGKPINVSQSPVIHRGFAIAIRHTIEHTQILSSVEGFAATVGVFRAARERGANVTAPFKPEAFSDAAVCDFSVPVVPHRPQCRPFGPNSRQNS